MSLSSAVQPQRIRIANDKPLNEQGAVVVYWMQASQRTTENPALNYAIELANKHKKELVVCFGLTSYPDAQRVHYEFMLEGLREVGANLNKSGITFVCKESNPVELVLSFNAAAIVCDENYTRVSRQWREDLALRAKVQVIIVDSNTIVPVRMLGKEEYAAYTIRPKLWAVASNFLIASKTPKYEFKKNDVKEKTKVKENVESTVPNINELSFKLGNKASRLPSIKGGESEALRKLNDFLDNIERYSERNDASIQATSFLSAYLHFGQISPVTVVLRASELAKPNNEEATKAFIEQVFVRREVAFNFTYYNSKYDSIEGLPAWAQATLAKHSLDTREHIYSYEELEQGKTHDELWNAAQFEMVRSGYMHNYMRMLWAKKILEWTRSPQEAFAFAIKLNDTYQLDGRDPNGYTGIAWSIGGKHDRPWFERAIYGQVRYMSTDAARKKFDAKKYISYVDSLRTK